MRIALRPYQSSEDRVPRSIEESYRRIVDYVMEPLQTTYDDALLVAFAYWLAITNGQVVAAGGDIVPRVPVCVASDLATRFLDAVDACLRAVRGIVSDAEQVGELWSRVRGRLLEEVCFRLVAFGAPTGNQLTVRLLNGAMVEVEGSVVQYWTRKSVDVAGTVQGDEVTTLFALECKSSVDALAEGLCLEYLCALYNITAPLPKGMRSVAGATWSTGTHVDTVRSKLRKRMPEFDILGRERLRELVHALAVPA